MRRIACLLALCVATTTHAQYTETITVSRIVLDTRVTDAHGAPITDLKPEDFTVKVGGAPAMVASATWLDETGDGVPRVPRVPRSSSDEEDADPTEEPEEPRGTRGTGSGRLIVIFVQTDFQRANLRMQRQMAFRRHAEEIIHSFDDDDRLAVFSFDSHLKFRCDLTTDKAAAIRAMNESILIDVPPPPPAVPEPSLAPFLDRQEMKRAVSSEAAMRIVGNALKQLEGPKTMLLLGWGLGVKHGAMVMTRHEWPAARAALQEARVVVMALNTGLGGELSYGMETAAKDTGGMYALTSDFPHQVANRVRGTMLGRWELELMTAQPLPPGRYAVDVRVRRRGAVVLAASTVTISAD
ncbi:MAG TPA: hypothetical protein VGF28_12915 [Thermoanaerobaculia bacterium]|jgi:hypothetical protein